MEAAAAERRVRRGARREICTCMVVVSESFYSAGSVPSSAKALRAKASRTERLGERERSGPVRRGWEGARSEIWSGEEAER